MAHRVETRKSENVNSENVMIKYLLFLFYDIRFTIYDFHFASGYL